MTPEERRKRELARIFQAGWNDGANDPPLTERQLERLAFILAPLAAWPRAPAPQSLPTAA